MIRPYDADDGPAIYAAAMESFAELNPFMPWCNEQYTMEMANAWASQQSLAFRDGTAYEFAIVDEHGQFLGGCGLNQLDRANERANLGYWVRTSAAARRRDVRGA